MKYAVIAASLLLLAACPSPSRRDETKNAPPKTSTTLAPGKTTTITQPQNDMQSRRSPAVANQTVEVQLVEYAVRVPQALAAGKYTLHIVNAGKEDHGFVLDGNATHVALAEALKRGDTTQLDVELKPGTYNVYCPVDKHKDRGMPRR